MKIYKYKDIYKDINDYFSENTLKDNYHKEKLKEILLLKEKEDKKKGSQNKKIFNFDFTNLRYKYSLAVVSAIALFLIILLFSFKLFFSFPDINSKVLILNGNVQIKEKNKKNYRSLVADKLIKSGDTIRSDKDSNVKIIFNNNSIINIYESSELKFVKLNKIKDDEKVRLFLNKGSVYCTVNLPSQNSNFEVYTDISKFVVKGTKFLVTALENKDIKLQVDESVVEVESLFKPLDKIKSIEKKDKSIYKKIINLFNYSFSVGQNESIIIKKGVVERINQKLSDLVDNVFIKTNKRDFSKIDKNELISKINELENDVRNISNLVMDNNRKIQEEPEKEKARTVIQNIKGESSIKKDTRKTFIYNVNNKDMFIGQDVLLETVDGSFLYGTLISHDGKIVKIEDETLGLIAIESFKVKSISFKR